MPRETSPAFHFTGYRATAHPVVVTALYCADEEFRDAMCVLMDKPETADALRVVLAVQLQVAGVPADVFGENRRYLEDWAAEKLAAEKDPDHAA